MLCVFLFFRFIFKKSNSNKRQLSSYVLLKEITFNLELMASKVQTQKISSKRKKIKEFAIEMLIKVGSPEYIWLWDCHRT